MKHLIPLLFSPAMTLIPREQPIQLRPTEAFLEPNQIIPKDFDAKIVLKSLYYEEATEARTLEAYDAYLSKYDEPRPSNVQRTPKDQTKCCMGSRQRW